MNARDDRDCRPLHFSSSVEGAELLLHAGANPGAKNKMKQTPSEYIAFLGGQAAIIHLLKRHNGQLSYAAILVGDDISSSKHFP